MESLEEIQPSVDTQLLVIPLIWKDDPGGRTTDKWLYFGSFRVGVVHSMGRNPVWWHGYGMTPFDLYRVQNYKNQKDAMLALQNKLIEVIGARNVEIDQASIDKAVTCSSGRPLQFITLTIPLTG